jgi:hypothetical protein
LGTVPYRLDRGLQPVGAIEYALAERVASLLRHLRRAAKAESQAAADAGSEGWDQARTLAERVLGLIVYGYEGFYPERPIATRLAQCPSPQAIHPGRSSFRTFSGYEYRLSRQRRHALHELRALQDRLGGAYCPAGRASGRELKPSRENEK